MVQPNEYRLTGGNITVNYLTANFLGQPFLSFNDGSRTQDFSGSAIRVSDVGIGTLVSVTTFMTIDTGATEFSVLLPFIELADATKTQQFSYRRHRHPLQRARLVSAHRSSRKLRLYSHDWKCRSLPLRLPQTGPQQSRMSERRFVLQISSDGFRPTPWTWSRRRCKMATIPR